MTFILPDVLIKLDGRKYYEPHLASRRSAAPDRDGYAKPNYINSLLYSGILMIVPTEYSAELLMALWIRVVPVL